uniref:Putative secreted peptide n=1 Tax=Anopheles braziliensis TaxID=58242 RepID=A0A2M3ZSX9_9DIPT
MRFVFFPPPFLFCFPFGAAFSTNRHLVMKFWNVSKSKLVHNSCKVFFLLSVPVCPFASANNQIVLLLLTNEPCARGHTCEILALLTRGSSITLSSQVPRCSVGRIS